MAGRAGVRDLVLVRHLGADKAECVRVNHGVGRAFGLNFRHVAGDTLTT